MLFKALRSSFFWPMMLMPRRERRAILAVYGYCRALDDAVDDAPPAEGRATLKGWRWALPHLPDYRGPDPLRRALAAALRDFALPPAELAAVIDGMAMDLDGMVAPDRETLRLYCRRVAGSVGLLTVRILGRGDGAADDFALASGEALQLANILRDVAEDAGRGRIYLPREVLAAAGVPADPATLLDRPGLPRAREALAAMALERFDAAERALERCGRERLWPAVAMLRLYRRLLDRTLAAQARGRLAKPRLGLAEGLALTLGCAAGRPPGR
ncbi:MAG TPA: squalene/phytoene synthase family protein [Alphaproteobacteria bacterium]|nr:squalene/phytoene synthase family protein [Alphaproteobacteria bacterium]